MQDLQDINKHPFKLFITDCLVLNKQGSCLMNIIPVVHHLIFSNCDWFKLLMCCDSVLDTLKDFFMYF